MNSTATLTEAELRGIAAEICSSFDRADAIRGSLAMFDLETESRLADFDKQIAAADSGGFEDVAGIQTALALKESRRRFVAQRASHREALAGRVSRDASAAVSDVDLAKFCADALAVERAKAVAAFLPFWENTVRADGAAGQCDSVAALARWSANLCHVLPPEVIVQRLRRFVAGEVPVWRI